MTTDVEWIAAAAARAATRIGNLVQKTPLEYSQYFSDAMHADVYFKLENRQLTGSFKLRGATNRLMTLPEEYKSRGCVAASSGNHGAAVACAMRELAVNGVIFVPERTSPAKVDAIKSYGGEVQYFGTDGLDTEQYAREYAERNGLFYLSPYNDAEVVAGQGTCGVEIAEQMPDANAVFVAVGGGGLIAGIGSVLKAKNPEVKLIGCQPEASAVMAKSLEAGRILDLASEPTLSDGTAGGIEPGAITFDLCRELVDKTLLVSEAQIGAAMRQYMEVYEEPIEGAAGVAIAAMLESKQAIEGRQIVVVICGGNVSQTTLDSINANVRRVS